MINMEKKIDTFKNIIENTIHSIQKYKSYDIFGANETNICISHLEEISNDIKFISSLEEINKLQLNLANIIKMFGTLNFDDMLYICFPHVSIEKSYKLNSIKKYVSPIGYKIIETNHKETLKELGIYKLNNYDCLDNESSNTFQNKVHGIKIYIKSKMHKILVYGLCNDIMPFAINDKYIYDKYNSLINKSNEEFSKDKLFYNYINSKTLKDLLIYHEDTILHQYKFFLNTLKDIKKKQTSNLVKDFVKSSLYQQRKYIIYLLIDDSCNNSQYLAYLLYDLLSSETSENIDTQEQIILFDGLPWLIKKKFKEAMKNTIDYTYKLTSFDEKKIPLEQQICLMSTTDNVKEKAMQKLTEVKSKTDDSATKARQYLDGLLKIPFACFKEESILKLSTNIKELYKKTFNEDLNMGQIKEKIKNIDLLTFYNERSNKVIEMITYTNKIELLEIVKVINLFLKNHSYENIIYSNQKIASIEKSLRDVIKKYQTTTFIDDIINYYCINVEQYNDILLNISEIHNSIKQQQNMMINVSNNLNKYIHGHEKPKRQIERIIAQWVNGTNNGYCLGFEGPPGVGKTSFAKKGVANCLLDENGESRPFAYIAIGGSSNGSILDGHNYTYVGSTWGRIVDIIIEKKCLNPIIFIDELDKVSKTEAGREIIGILTHLTDPSQNAVFQDKYFSGIDIDMSKALFIFSYNDVSLIDKILLDRIHRVKFDALNLDEKVEICKKYIIPELCENVGLNDSILFEDDVLEHIITNYTYESGVRKLKELLFEIIGELNLRLLNDKLTKSLPINVLKTDIDDDFFNEKTKINRLCINNNPNVGVVNGLWANAITGGILQIECLYYPTETWLDLKLTGLQGDVMKESMTVSKTLAWSLLTENERNTVNDLINENKMKGIHIHCPEGSVQKDGPSAGAAIVCVLYSLFTNKKINNTIALTGEINMQGKVTKIGGIDFKIKGGIDAGVKSFIIPEENRQDYLLFEEKNVKYLKHIEIYYVENIHQVLEIILVK